MLGARGRFHYLLGRGAGKHRRGWPVAVTAAATSGMHNLGGRALHGFRLADDVHQREPSRAALAELEPDLLRAGPHPLGFAEIGLSARAADHLDRDLVAG